MASTMRIIFLLTLIVIAPSAGHSQCLKCEPTEVTLKGTVYSKDFPGPPNYESIRAGDERMRFWILRVHKPICVEGDDFNKVRVSNVRDLQLAFPDESFYKTYDSFVRRHVPFQVIGSLFHQQTGHHVTKIVVDVKRLVPLGK